MYEAVAMPALTMDRLTANGSTSAINLGHVCKTFTF